MSVYEAVIELIGPPPPGYEILVWFLAGIILLFLIRSAFGILSSLLDYLGRVK